MNRYATDSAQFPLYSSASLTLPPDHRLMPHPPLNATVIQQPLIDRSLSLEVLETTTSTNDHLKHASPSTTPCACLSEQQTQGRGQHGKHWHSPPHQNLYLSYQTILPHPPSALLGLSLMVGLSIRHAIQQAYTLHIPIMLKWPNDLLCDSAKLGGILIDIAQYTATQSQVIIGIGLNVHMDTDESDTITQPWVSLEQLTDEPLNRNTLATAILNQLPKDLDTFSQTGFSAYYQEWNTYDALKNQIVCLEAGSQLITGTALGTNADGALLIQEDDHIIRAYLSGHIRSYHTPHTSSHT